MINPVTHGEHPDIYRVEPYSIAADIYSVEPRRGQGGWTWYTGSAGWFYRAATEAILGIRREGMKLFLTPCLPSDWTGYEATVKLDTATYFIKVVRGKNTTLTVDGKKISDKDSGIDLRKTGEHEIILTINH